jgi:2-(1,2-epoxy-1,2-dihydrophenyl)acetyl-CoA isomerase
LSAENLTEGGGADAVLFEMVGPVAVLTLNRSAVLNAIDIGLASRLSELLSFIEAEGIARCLLLRAAGRAFCAGGDLAAFREGSDHPTAAAGVMAHFHPAVLQLASFKLPTVAAVHGTIAGAGVGLMLACDFVVACAETRLTLAYPKIGGTIDGGASWFLPRIVGLRKARELALLGDTISLEEAYAIGLYNRAFPRDTFERDALAFATRLGDGPTASLAAIKRLLDLASRTTLERHLDLERDAFRDAAASVDFSEGLAAFFERRAPSFQGR